MTDIHPDLAKILVVAREGGQTCASVGMAVDWMMERGATLGDFLAGYAGYPPHWQDIVPLSVLALYLELQGDRRTPQVQVCMEAVPRDALPVDGFPDRIVVFIPWDSPASTLHRDNEQVLRYLKRRVLSLFPEVTATRRVEFSERVLAEYRLRERTEVVRNHLARNGMTLGAATCRHDQAARGIIYEQEVAAPDWVPPSEYELARSFRRNNPSSSSGHRAAVNDVLNSGRLGPMFGGVRSAAEERAEIEDLGR